MIICCDDRRNSFFVGDAGKTIGNNYPAKKKIGKRKISSLTNSVKTYFWLAQLLETLHI